MHKPSSQQSSSQFLKVPVCTIAVVNLSLLTMSVQSAQTAMNETLKQINATLQEYAAPFTQQDKISLPWINQ